MHEPLNIDEYEQLTRERLPQSVYDYFAGGAGDELTLRENREAWSQLRLRPRVLKDVSTIELTTTVIGKRVSMPLLIAPCALNTLAHAEGELAVARAADALGIVHIVSTLASYQLEDIASAAMGVSWFQLYCFKNRSLTRELVERAEAASYAALCLTVDVPVPGLRERDARNHFNLPPHVDMANLAHLHLGSAEKAAIHQYVHRQFDPSLTWETLDWLSSITRLPVVVKGILTAEDAKIAIAHNVAGICVSNHGGRQLDGVVTTCEALSEVVNAVSGEAEVFVDGGIRRGVDVMKAIALGARAVLIGRPYLWGLAINGEAGVLSVLNFLHDELNTSMALTGCRKIKDINRSLVKFM